MTRARSTSARSIARARNTACAMRARIDISNFCKEKVCTLQKTWLRKGGQTARIKLQEAVPTFWKKI
jgi:hypothetical protein